MNAPASQPTMPRNVRIVVVIAAVFLGLRVLETLFTAGQQGQIGSGSAALTSLVAAAMSLAIAALIITGLVKGHRLSWQWGRVLCLLGGILLLLVTATIYFAVSAGQAPAWILPVAALQAIALIGISVLLGTRDSCEYFRLYCPQCGEKGQPADFLFNQAKCKCGVRW